MINQPLIHPRTRIQLERFAERPTHGLLLVGDGGAGKKTLSLWVASKILNTNSVDKLLTYPYFKLLKPSEGSISIDDIRDLKHFLSLRTPGDKAEIRRVVVIPNAERLTLEAQNAFLKSLEEPPKDTLIILTSKNSSSLLPTITSRVQYIDVLPVSLNQALQHYNGHDKSEIEKNYLVSKGLTETLDSLMAEAADKTFENINSAKDILKQTPGERLMLVESLAKDKEKLDELLGSLRRIASGALTNSAKKSDENATTRWRRNLESIIDANDALTKNANIKLVLDNLFLSI